MERTPSKSKQPATLPAPPEQGLDRKLCRESFYYFIQFFWEAVVQEEPVWNWHIRYVANELQEAADRVVSREPKKADILINIPPGQSKSTIASVMFPAWLWTQDPSLKTMSMSYSQALSFNHAEKSRDIIRSEKWAQTFPDIAIRPDIDAKSRYQNTLGGERRATSVGGSVTGFHAHVLIIDDPLNPNEAVSEKDRDRANRFMTDTLPTRKIDKEVTLTILIMQRLHEKDPAGTMLAKAGKKIRHICIPGYMNEKVSPPELKERYIDGQMDPIRLSNKAMSEMRADMGSLNYSQQIGQETTPPGGNMWKAAWFTIKPREQILSQYKITRRAHDWDLAYTEKETNSASAYVETANADNNLAVLDAGYAHKEFPELIAWMKSLGDTHYIEAKASGKSAKQALTRQGIAAIEVNVPGGDKVAKTQMVTPYGEAGLIIIAREVADLLLNDPHQGVLKFPKTGTDLNDAFCQAINRLLTKKKPRTKPARVIRR